MNIIEFNGLALFPSFSIYLFEITKDEKGKFFYIGMTGDNYYPSARSILHRLAGHIDLLETSTQNQFIVAIKGLFGKSNQEDFSKEELSRLNIKLHYWQIEGFEKWQGSKQNFDTQSPEYQAYKEKQMKVLALENHLIACFKDKLLNKTKGVENDDLTTNEDIIYDEIKQIIGI
jgi:hypothetical protein